MRKYSYTWIKMKIAYKYRNNTWNNQKDINNLNTTYIYIYLIKTNTRQVLWNNEINKMEINIYIYMIIKKHEYYTYI